MPVDLGDLPPVDPDSPEGQDFARLGKLLSVRHDRLDRLDAYAKGEPPLPEGAESLRTVARDYFRTSRTNFAELVAEAPRERMQPAGVRTAVESGESGDMTAWALWKAAGLPVKSADVHQSMLALGDGYVIVSMGASGPIATAEDPRQVVTIHDPLTDEVVLAMKRYCDEDAGLDVAFVYRPGQVLVAVKKASPFRESSLMPTFNARDWRWDESRSKPLPAGFEAVIPVVRFKNRGDALDGFGGGCGEFERHIDVLDRINRTVLRVMVITTYQAFKQKAISGELPQRDDDGNLINYQELLQAGPDALWLLPPDAKIWESGQVDLTSILAMTKADVLFLAAVTRTPLAMLTPDAAAQSAEGASLQREGLVFKTEDRINRATHSWSQVMSLLLRFADDPQRADVASIDLMWAPVERFSISEQANAIAQTKGVMPRREQLIRYAGMTPADADRALSELTEDFALDQEYAAALKSISAPTTTITNNDAAAA